MWHAESQRLRGAEEGRLWREERVVGDSVRDGGIGGVNGGLILLY